MNTLYDSQFKELLEAEAKRQADSIELIASENYASPSVLAALASPFHNKYAEGVIGKRYYAGNAVVDKVEGLAVSLAKQLFEAEHVNVQPLSGAPANYAVLSAFLEPGDKFLALALDHGGHLTHGHSANFSGKLYQPIFYHCTKEGFIDMAEVEKLALEHKPKMIIAGFSSYSRSLNWQEFARIARENNAVLFGDIAHIAGLVAGKVLENPVPYCDVVATTTHKTLRGPRGAVIMCKQQYAEQIDKAVFPGLQGGPHQNVIFAKAVAFAEALSPEFRVYASQVVANSRALNDHFLTAGVQVISGGTDNHMFLLDTQSSFGLSGGVAQQLLEEVGIIVNKNVIPFDKSSPRDPSGIRLGSAAITTRGAKEQDMAEIAQLCIRVLKGNSSGVPEAVLNLAHRLNQNVKIN